MSSLAAYGILAPPTIFIVLCLLGPLVGLVWRGTGLAIALASGLCLFAAATPALSSFLMRQVEAAIPEGEDLASAQIIVVLSGDIRVDKEDDSGDELGPVSLERVFYAVAAYRHLNKPLAVTGGIIGEAHRSLGAVMRDVLQTDFGVPVTWTEEESGTTWENALFTARLLAPAGIKTVLVVTHSVHLPRALWSFSAVGLRALAWPAPRTAATWDEFAYFLPKIGALQNTFSALHEIIGGAYYRLCYGPQRWGTGTDAGMPTRLVAAAARRAAGCS